MPTALELSQHNLVKLDMFINKTDDVYAFRRGIGLNEEVIFSSAYSLTANL